MNEQIVLLQEIKSALWILVFLIGIGVALNILRVVISSYRRIRKGLENAFFDTTTAMFKSGNYDAVIEHCREHLKKKPEEAYGYWFLGKAHFHRKEYDEATRNFKKALEINPSWEEEWVSPYLEKIEIAKNAANKSLSQIGAEDAPPG